VEHFETKSLCEIVQVVGEVAEAPRRVEWPDLGVAVAAQVRGQPTVVRQRSQRRERLIEEARGGGVAVQEEDRDTVPRSARQDVDFEAWRCYNLLAHAFR
jgi:hypothetical protein